MIREANAAVNATKQRAGHDRAGVIGRRRASALPCPAED
jgi:hypothetical protein